MATPDAMLDDAWSMVCQCGPQRLLVGQILPGMGEDCVFFLGPFCPIFVSTNHEVHSMRTATVMTARGPTGSVPCARRFVHRWPAAALRPGRHGPTSTRWVCPASSLQVSSQARAQAQAQSAPSFGTRIRTVLVRFPLKRILSIVAGALLLNFAVAKPASAARSGGRIGGMRGSSFSSAYGTRSGTLGFGGGLNSRSSTSSMYNGSMGKGRGSMASPVRTNAFFFSPFGFGFGYGYPIGGGFMTLLFWGVFAAIVLQVIRGTVSDGSSGGYIGGASGYGKLSVAKVQVGLLSNARELQQDLERIASRADTSTPRGLHYVLQETVLSLLRNPEYCVYGFAKSGIEDSPEAAESRFNKLSLEERGKFQKETRVNVGGIKKQESLGAGLGRDGSRELIVVTVLVATEGRVRLPKVNSVGELRNALTTLGSLPVEDIFAVEVLWTPEDPSDHFSQEDLASDYPLLNTL